MWPNNDEAWIYPLWGAYKNAFELIVFDLYQVGQSYSIILRFKAQMAAYIENNPHESAILSIATITKLTWRIFSRF